MQTLISIMQTLFKKIFYTWLLLNASTLLLPLHKVEYLYFINYYYICNFSNNLLLYRIIYNIKNCLKLHLIIKIMMNKMKMK